jgi:hypothetical protein
MTLAVAGQMDYSKARPLCEKPFGGGLRLRQVQAALPPSGLAAEKFGDRFRVDGEADLSDAVGAERQAGFRLLRAAPEAFEQARRGGYDDRRATLDQRDAAPSGQGRERDRMEVRVGDDVQGLAGLNGFLERRERPLQRLRDAW